MITVLLRGAAGLTRAALFVLIARRFGAADFGRFALVFSFVEIVRTVADFGIDTVLIRHLSMRTSVSEALLRNGAVLKVILATAGYLTSLIVFPSLFPAAQATAVVLVVAATIYTTLLINVLNSYFQARLRMAAVMRSQLAGTLSYAVLTVLALQHAWPLAAVCAAMPVSEFVSLILTLRTYRRECAIRPGFDATVAGALLRESAPVAVSAAMIVAYMRIDHLFLGWYHGLAAVGQYSVAFRFTEPFMLVFTSLSLSFYAFLSPSFRDHPAARVQRAMVKILGLTFAATLLAALTLSLFSARLMSLVIAPHERPATALAILSAGIVFKATNAQLTAAINALGRYPVVTKIAGWNLGVNLCLALLLIPRYDIIGAATAVVLTEANNMLVQSLYVWRSLRGAAHG